MCLPPVGYAARLSGGVLGFPIPAQSGVFLLCPDRALFRTPFWGCLFFVDCGSAGGAYLCGMGKRNRGGCPVVSAKYAVNGEGVGFLLAFALAPLRVQLAVLSEFLQGCEVWLMLWPLLWA